MPHRSPLSLVPFLLVASCSAQAGLDPSAENQLSKERVRPLLAEVDGAPQIAEYVVEAFEDSRARFDVRYYLVAILFIVFDLEIAFLFPWAVALPSIGGFGLWAMGIFLFILVVGFIYEWKKGALEWD